MNMTSLRKERKEFWENVSESPERKDFVLSKRIKDLQKKLGSSQKPPSRKTSKKKFIKIYEEANKKNTLTR